MSNFKQLANDLSNVATCLEQSKQTFPVRLMNDQSKTQIEDLIKNLTRIGTELSTENVDLPTIKMLSLEELVLLRDVCSVVEKKMRDEALTLCMIEFLPVFVDPIVEPKQTSNALKYDKVKEQLKEFESAYARLFVFLKDHHDRSMLN